MNWTQKNRLLDDPPMVMAEVDRVPQPCLDLVALAVRTQMGRLQCGEIDPGEAIKSLEAAVKLLRSVA